MKHPCAIFTRRRVLPTMLAAAACSAMAAEGTAPAPQVTPALRPAWQGPAQPLAPEQLDRLRGGFHGPDGLVLSFGIERMVYVNGQLVTTTRIAVQGLGTPSAALAQPALPALSDLGTVVQNALNDQQIKTLTIVNASANSLDVLRSWSLQLSIRDAVAGSVRR
ncbi:MAG: hypothetical protein ACK5Y8_08765 [Betaproteobacteria bacterium]|nr:hypothetical protein [Rubrivivax sp.]